MKEQTLSWIFLSIAIASQKTPKNLAQILEAADYINRSIPSHQELINSIFWLKQQKLIFEVNDEFSLSELGKSTLEKSKGKKAIFDIWKNLEKEFIDMKQNLA
jgi:predicted transcriptional regulator